MAEEDEDGEEKGKIEGLESHQWRMVEGEIKKMKMERGENGVRVPSLVSVS